MNTPARHSPLRRSLFHRSLSLVLAVRFFCVAGFAPLPASASPGVSTAVTVTQAYDGNGNVTSRTDGNGLVTQYAYDARNRLVSVDYPGGANPDVSFVYDQNGNRTRMTDATGTTTYDYDLFDRLTGIDYPDGGFVSYRHDNVGNITDLLYGNYKTLLSQGVFTYIQYTFDEDNRIRTVKNIFTGHVTSYTYDDAGNVSRRTLPNGVYCDYVYDSDGRLTSVTHRMADTSLIVGFSYTLNAIGNRTSMTETLPSGPARVTTYTYDPLDRLDTVTYPEGRFVNYDYDSFGNRTKLAETISPTTTVRDYLYDSDSRLLSTTLNGAPEEKFYYDQTGNLIQRARVTDNRQINYVYDSENRLVRYYDGTNNVEYLYNGAGERIAKTVNGVRTNFINDPNRQHIQVLAETDEEGLASRVYEWGNELLNQEDINGAARNYYLHDAPMGSVRRLVDAGSVVVNSYEYDAFGKPTTKSEGVVNDYQFHGEVQEDETDLVFLRARHYVSDVGRFITRDIIVGKTEQPQSLNPYLFTNNNPISMRDPAGTSPILTGGLILWDWGTDYFFNEIIYRNNLPRSYWYGKAATTVASSLIPIPGNAWITRNLTRDIGAPIARAYSSLVAERLVKTAYSFGNSLGRGISNFFKSGRPGGVSLNKTASVLLDINSIAGGTYDEATGQILLFGKADNSPTALPKMSIDDLAVAFRAVQQGSMPVVSIEDPVVNSPPEWPGRSCFTVRYGPFYTDPADGQRKVLDLSSKTHFGWVMFDADRHMKCLGLGKDNRTGAPVSSNVSGNGRSYRNLLDLGWQYGGSSQVTTRFWFNPKIIEIEPSADGKSMELKRAEMQLSTETMFSSAGEVESTPDAEYFAGWFTDNYDAIANEQITYDAQNQPHYIFKELKQLAAIVGVVKWIQDNNVPVDLSFLKNYTPIPYPEAMDYTPQTSVTRSETSGPWFNSYTRTLTILGGVNYCNDLAIGAGGNPSGLAAGALGARPAETNLAWNFSQAGQNYNVSAVSVDKKEKDGGYARSDEDARLAVQGSMPLALGRYFDSFDVGRSMFGHGWTAQPYALQFKGEPTGFDLCGRSWNGFAEVNFNDRAGEQGYKFTASGMYDKVADPLHIASRFDPARDILVYRYETKGAPGLLFADTKTRFIMRLASGMLLDFDLKGTLTGVEDRNGNRINYNYDASNRLTSINQPSGRTITFTYDAQNRVSSATLPDSHAVTYLYDGSGNLASAQVDAPSGRKRQYAYNASHEITEVRDEAGGAVETRAFDSFGRVSTTTQPGVPSPIAQSFSLANRTSSATGPNGYSQATAFNENYDPVTITDARGNSDTLTYNRYRDVITERKADGRTYQYYYDSTGRRIATVHPNGRADVTYFDNNGNPIVRFHGSMDAQFASQFDAEHVIVGFGIDAFAVDTTSYLHDAQGNQTRVTDANAHERNFGYDAMGNQSYARDGRGKQTDFTFDAFSRRTRVKNALNHQTDFTYDERDNLTRVTTAAGTVDSAYNLKNERTSVTTGNVGARRTTGYTYNARGQIATVTDPAGFVTAYAYDARSNLTNITHNGVVRFTYEYDGLNRLTATRYTGTAGGGDPAIVPLSPRGAESLSGSVAITWQTRGDWTGNPSVTLQYSTNGSTWTTIATVANSLGSYVWNTGNLASTTLQIRFIRPGDAAFHTAVTAPLRVLNGGKYYVNDNSTAGDQYCTAAGQTYNGTTVTGLSPATPVNSIQAIINNYVLLPGDTVYVDTGDYAITTDILITENDAGTVQKPVTITGPTAGGAAVITHQNPATSGGCLLIAYTGTPGKLAEGFIVEHLSLTGATNGIGLSDAINCIVRHNRCYGNGVDGAAGEDGDGNGILSTGGGNHTIEHNLCYENGALGGAGGTAAMNGGNGRGAGILISGSSGNQVRFNTCYDNGGTGGAAGSATALPGYSEGVGIFLQTAGSPTEDNQVTDNECYNNDAFGRDDAQADGGLAKSSGITLIETNNSNIERNNVHDQTAYGGRSWNGSTGGKGGWGLSYGIQAANATGLVVTKNKSFSNFAFGDYGGDDPDDEVGTGWAVGIFANQCPGALIKNNLCYNNVGGTSGTYGTEPQGGLYSSGIEIMSSPDCSVLNNTLIRNEGLFLFSGGTDNFRDIITQIYVWSGSSGLTIKNNVFDASQAATAALWIADGNIAGTTSDSNDFYVRGFAFAGFWGSTYCPTLASWKTASGQDALSVNADPKYYNTAVNDYRLASTSPLIDAGETLSLAQEDLDGESRPADGPDSDLLAKQDIGADEFIDSDRDTLADIIEQTVTLTRGDEPDSDFDGLPDGWEVVHGLDPNISTGVNGAGGNPDGDAYTNLQEFQGGSNPKLAASVPAQPPVLTAFFPSGSNLFILEQDSVPFSASAADANGDPVGYSWRLDGVVKSTASSWLLTTTDESSGDSTLAKTYQVELRVDAGTDTVTRAWTVVVNNRNRSPVLAALSNLTVSAGAVIALNPVVSDPDNLNGVPGDDNALTVDYSGFLSGPNKTVTAADAGVHLATVRVRDHGLPDLSQERTIQIRVVVDSDNDGLPDDIETAIGLNPNFAADALIDSDGDGVNNLNEFLSDTNPHDVASVLRIIPVRGSGQDVLVRFPTSVNKRYRVEWTASLGGVWSVLADNLPGTGGTLDIPSSQGGGDGRRYYRIVVLP